MRADNWLNHALRRSAWRPQRQLIVLIAFVVVMGILFGGAYLSQVASIATTGRQLETLIDERNELERTNEQLRAEIAQFQTVFRLQTRARELGYVEAEEDDQHYLFVAGYTPNRVDTNAPVVEPAAPAPVYDETFSGWLQQYVDALAAQFAAFAQTEG
jgi:cell division protein FtsB